MLAQASKVSTLLTFFVLMTACSTDAGALQTIQKVTTVEEPTAAPTLVPSPQPPSLLR